MTWERQDGRAAGDHDRARLKTLEVFALLSDAELQQILSVAIWRHYESGQLIDLPVRDGDVEGIVVEGGVRLLRISETGRVLTEREVGRGEFFDFGSLLGLSTNEFVVEAIEPSLVCFIPWPAFVRMIVEKPAAAIRLIEHLRQEGQRLGEMAGDAILEDVSTHIRHVLRSLAMESPERVVSRSLEELAALTGASVSQVSRVLAELRREGVLNRVGQGRLVIPNPDDLL